MTTNAHTDCTHPATKAGRAACRKARAAGTTIMPIAAVAKAAADAPVAIIKSIKWERVTCDRCGGTGTMPFSAWGGVCLKCMGPGTVLTRAGKAARDKYTAYLVANHSKMMIDLQPGDVVRDNNGKRRTVVSVDPIIRKGGQLTTGIPGTESEVTMTNLHIIVNYKNESHHTGAYSTIIVPPEGEALQAAMRHVANMKGAIIEYAN